MMAVIASTVSSVVKIIIDACLSWHPTTLPLAPEKIIRTDYLNQLLQEHGASPRARGAKIRSLNKLDIQVPSSNCNNFILELDWLDPGQMPSTAFIKIPCSEFTTRWFCNVIRVWELECNFLRHFAKDFPVRLPEVYAIASQRSRFILLQENLQADPTVELFTNKDMVMGCSLDIAKNCLTAFAKVHARYNDLSREEQESKLPYVSHPFLSPTIAPITRAINKAAIDPCRKKAAESFPESVADTYRLAMQHWDELLQWWYQGPLTLIHGDSHLGNIFAHGNEVGLFDFQAAQWGKGIRDVQYFLIDSLPESVLADNEQQLLAYYLEQCAAHGLELDFDEAWEQYRAYSFQTLMTNVVSLGLGALTEKDRVIEVLLRRSVAACERLEFRAWLEDLIGGLE